MNNDDSNLFVDDQWIGTTPAQIMVSDSRLFAIKIDPEQWAEVVIEDVFDAEVIGDTDE